MHYSVVPRSVDVSRKTGCSHVWRQSYLFKVCSQAPVRNQATQSFPSGGGKFFFFSYFFAAQVRARAKIEQPPVCVEAYITAQTQTRQLLNLKTSD